MGTVYTFSSHLMSYIEGVYSSHESGENMCGMTAGSSVRNEQTALLMSVDHHTHTHTRSMPIGATSFHSMLGWGRFWASKATFCKTLVETMADPGVNHRSLNIQVEMWSLSLGIFMGSPFQKNEILVVSRGLSSYKRLGKIHVISTRSCKNPGTGIKDPPPNRNWNKTPKKVGLVTTDKLHGVITLAPEKIGNWCFFTSKSGVTHPYF